MQHSLTPDLSGFLLVNKPIGITSFKCIAKIRHLLPHHTRIGHAGTLDPFASGLLIVAIGRSATKKISQLMNCDKTYIVKAKLGELTDTLDHTGTIMSKENLEPFTEEVLAAAIRQLGSSYQQTPPIYSALSHEGVRLYNLARSKTMDEVQLREIANSKKRTIDIHELTIIAYEHPFMTFSVRVSKGTYIRSLANDLAQLLGTHATTYELTRTAIGQFRLENAKDLHTLLLSKEILSRHIGDLL